MNEASLISGILFFMCFIGFILAVFAKESSLPKTTSTISSAPFWINVIWVAISNLPYKFRKFINVLILLILTILFGYLFISTF
ncbi:hypothetical protein [Lysinibacillus agricola]|uniref:Uncharacterized protein n=1 Tax=Lysinibacillus xylanilyticus TaxID=582475 RepID=A0ABV3VT75_9BACI